MSNIYDYVGWRGDIPFSAMGLNDVDNLILSTLSYVRFEDIVPGPGEGEIPLSQAATLYADKFPDWNKEARFYLDEPPKLLMKCASSRRFSQTLLRNYVSQLTDEIQFSALEILLPDGSTFISFRGTDESIIGWKEDFYLSLGTVPAQTAATAYLNALYQDRPLSQERIYLGGHSKGGNLAEYAGATCQEPIQNQILRIFNNDGPGFEPDFLSTPGYQNIASRISFFIPICSVVGALLKHGVEPKVIQSTDKTIMSHDPFTWQLMGPVFDEAPELDKSFAFLNQALDDWITDMSPEDRKLFIDQLFAVLEAPGLTTFREMYNTGFSVLTPMMQQLTKADPKSQKIILQLIRTLLENASELATSTLSKWFPLTEGHKGYA